MRYHIWCSSFLNYSIHPDRKMNRISKFQLKEWRCDYEDATKSANTRKRNYYELVVFQWNFKFCAIYSAQNLFVNIFLWRIDIYSVSILLLHVTYNKHMKYNAIVNILYYVKLYLFYIKLGNLCYNEH